MARIRTIKPDFWTDGTIIKLSPFARLLYIGMWNFALCDSGHVDDDLLRLKLQILPMDDVDVEALLQELLDSGRVARLTLDSGETFLHVTRLREHQKVDNRWKPRCPACNQEASPELTEPRASFGETHRDSPELTQTHPGKERKGKERKSDPGKPDAPSPEHRATDAAYQATGKAFNFIGTRGIAKWAIHERGESEEVVTQAIIATYRAGKPITKQTIGQHLDGYASTSKPTTPQVPAAYRMFNT